MFAYPQQAEFNRVLPKNIIYKNAKPSNAVKKRFVSEVKEIVWKYKLSKDTINLTPKDGLNEIQIFEITLKGSDLNNEVLKVIDKAIPYPIFYRLKFENRIKCVTAYKRVSEADKCVIGDYFDTGWNGIKATKTPLPVALDMNSLYEEMIKLYIGLPPRKKETLESLVERVQLIRKKQRDIEILKKKITKEIQFNRKVDINTQIRNINNELIMLMDE